MLRLTLLVFLFFKCILADANINTTNTNITVDDKELYNYNRLRVDTDYFKDAYFIKIIADAVNYYGKDYLASAEFQALIGIDSDTTYSTKTNHYDYKSGSVYAKLYRLYGGYQDGVNSVILGLQNITMGVGRIWTPTNRFNPKNIYAIEPDETFGVSALSYIRHLDDTSSIMAVAAQRADSTFKYALRYKAFLDSADIAIDIIKDKQSTILGLEIEADLLDTGAEVRIEAAYDDKKDTYEAIAGFDYGFVDGTTLIVESLYRSEYDKFYTALSLTQSFNIFLDASLVYIDSFDDESSYFAPTLTYTMNDFNSFTFGAKIYDENTYFFKWSLSF